MPVTVKEVRDVRAFCRGLLAEARAGRLNAALDRLIWFVADVILRESSYGVVFSSPELDETCLHLGAMLGPAPAAAENTDTAVFLVTALAPVGGHSRVVLDLAEADPARKKIVLATHVLHESVELPEMPWAARAKLEIEHAPAGDFSDRLRWMRDRLAQLRPARAYVLQHNFDAVCIAAAQPGLAGRYIYFHHCDHNLALGVHLPHALHIDFNAKGLTHCRDAAGITGNVLWPLTARIEGSRAGLPFNAAGDLLTATSGSFTKFDTSHLLERVPYLYRYAALLPRILQATGGSHVHIGPLRDDMQAEIAEELARNRIDPSRFIHLPEVASLSGELVARKVDLYVGSFPYGGGRAAVEAMGAGVPLLLHLNYRSQFFTDAAEVYPGAMTWRTPEELTARLAALDPDLLADQARRAREHFLAHHAPERLASAMQKALAQPASPAPCDLREHRLDPLQAYLDAWAERPDPREPSAAEQEAARRRPLSSPDAAEVLQRVRTKDMLSVLLRRLGGKAGALAGGRRRA